MWESWREDVIYQVFVPSFQDSDGDGFGDLGGVERRLAYLRDLGVDALWLSPVYRSPMLDAGYDVCDYLSVDPRFGDLSAMDRLISAAHAHDLRLVMDFVPNHTSDRHPWFQDALSGRAATHRSWYIWADAGPNGGPPNNWASAFGGSAWTLHEQTGQYYYHAHLPQQPNLNWREPAVKAAMFDAMRFWLARGVDGFRIDAVWRLFKDAQLRDNPAGRPGPGPASFEVGQPQVHTAGQPELAGLLREMRAVADEFDGRLLMGELHLSLEEVAAYGEHGLDIPMNFALIDVPWDGRSLARLIRRYEAALSPEQWPNWVLSNHDRSRLASRLGAHNVAVALTLLLTVRGTPTLYYGDELGLPDSPVPADRVRDGAELRAPGCGFGRDAQRMPMPWTPEIHAGFTDDHTEPWLPIPPWAGGQSVAAQQTGARTPLQITRELLALRRSSPALRRGPIHVLSDDPAHLSYLRGGDDGDLLVALNLSTEPVELAAPEHRVVRAIWRSDRAVSAQAGELAGPAIVLPPHGAAIAEVG